MFDRRHSYGVRTTDFSLNYIRMLDPRFVVVQWYMFGDHGYFCPVEFR